MWNSRFYRETAVLEYRGYDSAGIAVRDGEHLAQVVKAKGRLIILLKKRMKEKHCWEHVELEAKGYSFRNAN